MSLSRDQRFMLNLAIAIVGAMVIALVPLLAIGHAGHQARDPGRIVVGTIAVALAMVWACGFAARAHLARDEFHRQRELAVWYWGGWLGVGATTPVFFLAAMSGLRWFDPMGAASPRTVWVFTLGYVLPVVGGVLGATAAGLWARLNGR